MNCNLCGIGPRLPSLLACWACYVVQARAAYKVMHDKLTDPTQPPPTCSECGKAETTHTEDREDSAAAVSLAIVEGSDVWTCMGCLMGGNEGEEWKS